MDKNTQLSLRKLGHAIQVVPNPPRLDSYLANNYKFLSRSAWQKKILSGELLLNHQVVKASQPIRQGDQCYLLWHYAAEPVIEEAIKILWREQELATVYKPAGLPMHENGLYFNQTFAAHLKTLLGDNWAAVHRLDRETSGIVLCSSKVSYRQNLSQQFAEKKLHKKYLAMVHGTPILSNFIVDQPIGQHPNSQIRIKRWIRSDGQPAQTEFRLLEKVTHYSLLEAVPLTGRTNQIRVHLAAHQLPIIGDKLYHQDEQVVLNFYENKITLPLMIAATGFHRHCLHAYHLSFHHPDTKTFITIACPLPDDMSDLWQQLTR